MNAREKDMFLGMLDQLESCKTVLRLSRDMAYKYNDTMYVPFINDALVHIDRKLERVNEYLFEMKQKKGQ